MTDSDDIPHATHEGEFTIFGKTLRCYRLSNGEAVFNGGDFEAFMAAMFGESGETIEVTSEDEAAIKRMQEWMSKSK